MASSNPSLAELHAEDVAQEHDTQEEEDDAQGDDDSIKDAKKVTLHACCLLMV